MRGDTQIGQLDEAAFLATLLEWQVTGYFRVVDGVEADVDRLDELALLEHGDREFLGKLVRLRRRVAELRRLLTPHRGVFAALARPDFELLAKTESAAHFRALNDRLERAIDAVENAREMVLGSFELYMTGTAQNTNNFVKLLTSVTVLVGLLGVIAGVMGINFEVEFFRSGMAGFLLVIAGMVVLAGGILALAWRRRWFD